MILKETCSPKGGDGKRMVPRLLIVSRTKYKTKHLPSTGARTVTVYARIMAGQENPRSATKPFGLVHQTLARQGSKSYVARQRRKGHRNALVAFPKTTDHFRVIHMTVVRSSSQHTAVANGDLVVMAGAQVRHGCGTVESGDRYVLVEFYDVVASKKRSRAQCV